MRILVEGDLRKRCATLPMMRKRYCMLVVDDSHGSSKLKVLLRSYRSQRERDANIDGFVSSHVVKCVGEWTGKGNLHTYPHAFVVETVQSKLFHCSAPSGDAKERWMHAIPVAEDGLYNVMGLPGMTPVLSMASQDEVPSPLVEAASVRESTFSNVRSSHNIQPEGVYKQRESSSMNMQSESSSSILRKSQSNLQVESMKQRESVLFEKKITKKQRDFMADLEIESDEEDTRPTQENLLLDASNGGMKNSMYEDDLIGNYGQTIVPPMKLEMKYEVDPTITFNNRPIEEELSDTEENVGMNQELYARFSKMRMQQAKDAKRRHKDDKKQKKSKNTESEDDKPAKPRKSKKKKEHKKKHREASPSPPAPQRIAPPLPVDDYPPPLPQQKAVPTDSKKPQAGLQLPDIEGF
ncbi:hypothetical protein THRCLA_06497 [Thraustotheca clavata]|uniref:PH domain-containing protein n=1 Tax=Thraustotheca clavata TaxID=74557 RepID=A0A1V9ZNE6_9STRA|nr:hypothetical protein THRCLA_06497 [Thraustotheca clavata]